MKTICVEFCVETNLQQKQWIEIKKYSTENTFKHLKVVCIKIKTIDK